MVPTPGVTSTTSPDPSDGIVRTDRQFSRMRTVLSGQNVAALTLMGQITASGKWIKSLSGASDGSEVPAGVMADACDASAGDKSALIYLNGDFDEDAIVYGASHTKATVMVGLAKIGIRLHPRQLIG